MDETPDEITTHIDRTRERLGSNLKELQDKVDAATDWGEHFRARPLVFLGAAFVGGACLAATLGAEPSVPGPKSADALRPLAGHRSSAQGQALALWSNVKVALIGVASARLQAYLNELVPGFDEQYRRAEQRTATSSRAGLDV